MPIANLTLTPSARLAGQVSNLLAAINQARRQAAQLLEIANQETDGTTFTQVETQFGVPAGSGQTFYNLLAGLTGTTGALEAAAVVQFCGRLG